MRLALLWGGSGPHGVRPGLEQAVVGAARPVQRVQVRAGDEGKPARQLLALPLPVPAQHLVRRRALAPPRLAASRSCAGGIP